MLLVFPLDNTLEQIHEPASWQIRTLLWFEAKIVRDKISFKITV
jgi:hypothetical protein